MKLIITRPVVITSDGGTRSFVPGLTVEVDAATADVVKATEYLSDLAQQHIPNAAARALTRTAFDARDAVRDGLPERFNLRRPWISRGIGVTPAKPRTLMAEVWSRDRFMAAQESGGSHPDARPIPAGRAWCSSAGTSDASWRCTCCDRRPSDRG